MPLFQVRGTVEPTAGPVDPGDACKIDEAGHGAPFIARYSRNGRHLSFIATHHGRSLTDPSHRLIASSLSMPRPDLVIVEGMATSLGVNPVGLIEQAKVRALKQDCPENIYAIGMAGVKGIPVLGGDMAPRELFAESLARGYQPADVIGAHVLRLMNTGLHPSADAALASVRQYADKVGGDPTFNFDSWFERSYGHIFALSDSEDGTPCGAGIGSEIVRSETSIRNKRLLSTILSSIERAQEILVIFGSGHFEVLAPDLTARMGQPRLESA